MDEPYGELLARLVRLEATVEELRSKQEIAELLYTASRALDRADVELLASCFHPDATDYRGVVNGPAHLARDSLPKWDVAVCRHATTNIMIDLDGDVAQVESYVQAFHHAPNANEGQGQYEFIQARYLDRLERRDGKWKIARRMAVWDDSWVEPVPSTSWFEAVSGDNIKEKNFIWGRRDRQDPVYHFDLPEALRHHEPDASY